MRFKSTREMIELKHKQLKVALKYNHRVNECHYIPPSLPHIQNMILVRFIQHYIEIWLLSKNGP